MSAFRPMNRAQSGFSLIELMIAVLIGLVVVAAAGSIYISNRRAYAATEAVSRIQEGSRTAFEMMARDIREAAAVPCGQGLKVGNSLNPANVAAGSLLDWSNGIHGYDNSDPPSWQVGGGVTSVTRVAGTDVLDMHSGYDTGVSVETHNAPSAEFKVDQAGVVKNGEILMVCDYSQASIFQVTSANNSNRTVVHDQGNSEWPGNCTKALGYDATCSTKCNNAGGGAPATPTSSALCKEYGQNSMIVRMGAARWFLGNTAARGNALYRTSYGISATGSLQTLTDEIVGGVTDLQFKYLARNGTAYVDAGSIADWSDVIAVKVELKVVENDKLASGSEAIERDVAFTVNLRNRVN